MTDKLAKTRLLIDMSSTITRKYYIPEQNLALDESQILCCAQKTRFAHRGVSTTSNHSRTTLSHLASMRVALATA